MIKNIVRHIFGLIIIATCLILASALLNNKQVDANIDCRPVVVLYARGSGQVENADEKQKLQTELNRNIGVNNYHFIELLSDMPGFTGGYPAVSLSNRVIPGLNAIDAEFPLLSNNKYFSWLNVGSYNDSVRSGVDLAIELISNSPLINSCPNTRVILSGYSQGAHVMGNVLSDKRLQSRLDKIAYTALFGDPKLNHGSSMPGFAGAYQIPAPWLRGDIANKIGSGILDGRVPYVPDNYETFRVGSWCYSQDPVCSGNYLYLLFKEARQLHGYYGTLYIPEAAKEISTVLFKDTGVLGAASSTCGAERQDVVVAIDLNEVMRRDTTLFSEQGAKYLADNIFNAACNVRIALVGYNQNGNEDPRLLHDFTTSRQDIIDTLTPFYKNTEPQTPPFSPVREAAIYAMDLNWRQDAQKAVLLVFNSMGTGWENKGSRFSESINILKAQPLTKQLVQKARDKGGVQLFTAVLSPNIQGGVGDSYLQYIQHYSRVITEPTAGSQLASETRPNLSWQNVRLYGLDQSFTDQPTVKVTKVKARAGQPVSIGAIDSSGNVIKKSLSIGRTTDYSWYLDCEDPLKQTNLPNNPNVVFTPQKAGKCIVAVKTVIYTSYCNFCVDPTVQYRKSHNVFELEVLPADYSPPDPPPQVINIKQVLKDGLLTIAWDAESTGIEEVFVIRDANNQVIGITQEKQLIISDINLNEPLPVISISNVSEERASEPVLTTDAPLEIIEETIEAPVFQDTKIAQVPISSIISPVTINPSTQTLNEEVMGAVDENENITQKEDKTEKNHQVQPNSSYDNNISTVAKIWILVSALAVFIAVSLLIIIKERQRQN